MITITVRATPTSQVEPWIVEQTLYESVLLAFKREELTLNGCSAEVMVSTFLSDER